MGTDGGPAWLSRITDAYSMLWKMIIRPPRDIYAMEELGPSKFRLGKRVYERHDMQLKSVRGFTLECSHFLPNKHPEAARPCVVYLHGNCSSRLEAFDALPVLLPKDLTVFCLDLSGSGRSQGEYISLGHHEEQDLRVVLEHLRSTGMVTSIGLWGRSMGAATAILRAAEDHNLAACVLDSPFGDLKVVAEELVNRGRFKVPQFVVNMGLEVIRNEVRARAGFDLHELNPIKSAPLAACPALFGVAADDSFVLPHHTQDLHNAWTGERVMRVFDGGHNGVRPSWFLEEASEFLCERLESIAGTTPPASSGSRVPARRVAALGGPEHLGGQDVPDGIPDHSGEDPPEMVGVKASSKSSTTASPPAESGSSGREDEEQEEEEEEHTRRGSLVQELQHLGFSEDAALEAAAKCNSLEASVEWLLQQSGEALGTVDLRPTAHRRMEEVEAMMPSESAGESLINTTPLMQLHTPEMPVAPNDQGLEETAPSARRSFPWLMPSSRSSNTASATTAQSDFLPGANLFEQLRFLGFERDQCNAAVRRCRTVEAAVEWLSAQRATVQL